MDAPLIDELPMAVECKLIFYDPETCRLVGQIVNVLGEKVGQVFHAGLALK